MHENEENWTERGRPKFYYVDPPRLVTASTTRPNTLNCYCFRLVIGNYLINRTVKFIRHHEDDRTFYWFNES